MKRGSLPTLLTTLCVFAIALASCKKEGGGDSGKGAGGSMPAMKEGVDPKAEIARYGFNKAFAIRYYRTLARILGSNAADPEKAGAAALKFLEDNKQDVDAYKAFFATKTVREMMALRRKQRDLDAAMMAFTMGNAKVISNPAAAKSKSYMKFVKSLPVAKNAFGR